MYPLKNTVFNHIFKSVILSSLVKLSHYANYYFYHSQNQVKYFLNL